MQSECHGQCYAAMQGVRANSSKWVWATEVMIQGAEGLCCAHHHLPTPVVSHQDTLLTVLLPAQA